MLEKMFIKNIYLIILNYYFHHDYIFPLPKKSYMIEEALTFLAKEMNEYFRNTIPVKEDKVILSALVSQDGSIAVVQENMVVITLVNIEKESFIKNMYAGTRPGENAAMPVSVNLYLLFSAYFTPSNYILSLRFISLVISYLQQKNVFNAANSPRLDSSIEKLSFEMESVGAEKLSNVWATLGAKYMPSVLYKMRMLTYYDSNISEFRPPISGTETKGIPS